MMKNADPWGIYGGNPAKLIKELDSPLSMGEYRDNIHVNDKGQRRIAEVMKSELINMMSIN